MITVRELTTRLGFDADTGEAKNYDKTLADVRRTALRAAAAMTALAAGTFEVARRMANTGNEIAKSAVETGLAADEFQRLTFAIGQVTRLTDQQAQQALMRLNDTIGRARIEGGRYSESLERLGFSQAEIAAGNIDNADAFRRLTEEIANTESAADAAALASRVFGERVGRQLGPAIRENIDDMRAAAEEADRLGGGWSDASLTASEDFVDAMGRVGVITSTLTSKIAERLLPAVQSTIDAFVSWWSANREIIQQNVGRLMDRLAVAFRVVSGIVVGFARAANNAAEAVGGWGRVITVLTHAVAALVALRVARWVWAVAGALTAAAKAGGVLRLALLALQRLGIIALFTGLALAIEDVITWITGGDSVLGKWLGTWDDFQDKVAHVFGFLQEWLDPLIRQFEALGAIMVGALTLDKDAVLQGLRDLGSAMLDWGAQLARGIRDAFLNILPDWMVTALGKAGGVVSDAAGLAKDSFGMAGSALDSARTGVMDRVFGGRDVADDTARTGGSRGAYSVNARIDASLQVPSGTSEEQNQALRSQAEAAMSEFWDRQMNAALWNLQPVD